ncbi:MAG: 1-deoxy-D-xylulose-5-phosphate reductoisomerase [Bacilli bacterium]|nr:1-deoxy-D-xylulose-5-phosphate reductoisomerase [Bacilli bacterium]
MKDILLLGASGSIGTQALEIIRENKEYNLKSISVGKNIQKAIEIIDEFKPEFVSVINQDDCELLKNKYPNIEFSYGDSGLIKAATYSENKAYLINALVGMVGLLPTIEAIKAGHDILLANKETLVTAGSIVMDLAKKHNVNIIPIDSEHSTIYQCMLSGKREDVSRIIITASGGSFRDRSREELKDVSVKEALNHPNWNMGAKITIDSATMVNKGLEVIEAHYLFDIDYDNIETVIHKESIVHSLVEFKDGAIIAGLSYPDMRIPIHYAISNPKRIESNLIKKMDFKSIFNLSFIPMDYNRYPLLELAYKVGKMGGIMPMVYNSANEVAVKLFLEGKINFLGIDDIILYAVNNTKNIINARIEDIINTDKLLRLELLQKFEVN